MKKAIALSLSSVLILTAFTGCKAPEDSGSGTSGGAKKTTLKVAALESAYGADMWKQIKEAFEKERAYQEESGIHCTVTVDGYTDFIFVNRFGECQHQGTLNKAIRRIIRDCNDEELTKNPDSTILLPRFSCHTLRHTFTTRMCEAGVNVKVIQDALGHSDISTTLNIYADVTKELRKSEFENLDRQFAQWKVPEE